MKMGEKNSPELKPFIAMKATSGTILEDRDQMVSMLHCYVSRLGIGRSARGRGR